MVNRKCPAYYWLVYIAKGLAFCCLLWLTSSPEPLGEVVDLLGGSGHRAGVASRVRLEDTYWRRSLGFVFVLVTILPLWSLLTAGERAAASLLHD